MSAHGPARPMTARRGAGLAALAYAVPSTGLLTGAYGWRTAVFFLVFGLFTITTYSFAGLMRVLCERNGGTFVALTEVNR